MQRTQGWLVAIALGGVAAAGTFAIARSASVGAAPRSRATVSDASIVNMTRLLAKQEARLRRALAKRPPKLPPVPVLRRRVVVQPVARSSAVVSRRVLYVRPKPVVVIRPRSGGEHEAGHGQDPVKPGARDD